MRYKQLTASGAWIAKQFGGASRRGSRRPVWLEITWPPTKNCSPEVLDTFVGAKLANWSKGPTLPCPTQGEGSYARGARRRLMRQGRKDGLIGSAYGGRYQPLVRVRY